MRRMRRLTKKQVNRANKIITIIRRLEQTKELKLKEVVEEAKKAGLKRPEIDSTLRILQNSGDIRIVKARK